MPTYKLSGCVDGLVETQLSVEETMANLRQLRNQSISLNPRARTPILSPNHFIPTERKPGPLQGTIGLLDISKPMGNFLLDRIQARFARDSPLLTVKRYVKPTFSRPAPQTLLETIAMECDYVVSGVAD